MAQNKIEWSNLPTLPGTKGWAGMFAGISNDKLFCLGGANFPGKPPWEGGKKRWYDDIYMLQDGKVWIKLQEKLPFPLAYGVSISYKGDLIIIGGSNENKFSDKVMGYKWNGKNMQILNYPDLPITLANMAGTLVGSLVIIAGGSSSSTASPLAKCYALDLENKQRGWFDFPAWPGRERSLPICTAYNGKFYLFSGETSSTSAGNKQFRHILQDAYCLTIARSNDSWTGSWEELAPMPKGMSAGGSPVPVLNDGSFFFWGGVDAVSALHTDAATEKGISPTLLLYHPSSDTWEYLGDEKKRVARVTLPVVFWNNQWAYISGEIRSGVRINTIITVR